MKANRGIEKRRRLRQTVLGLASVALLMPVAPLLHAQEQDARSILKSMAEYVSSQPTIQLEFDSSIEVITSQLEKIQFTNSGGVVLQRPDRLYGYRDGGYSGVELFYNGKTVSVLDREENAYAQFEGPENLDQLQYALREGHGVALPGADLLLEASYQILVTDVMEAKYIGHGVIGGRVCEHLAFRNFDTDWQLWVETGERPIPRKLVITSKTLNSAPQYSVTITKWRTDVELTPGKFNFTPPVGSRKLEANALVHLDELPPSQQEGERQ